MRSFIIYYVNQYTYLIWDLFKYDQTRTLFVNSIFILQIRHQNSNVMESYSSGNCDFWAEWALNNMDSWGKITTIFITIFITITIAITMTITINVNYDDKDIDNYKENDKDEYFRLQWYRDLTGLHVTVSVLIGSFKWSRQFWVSNSNRSCC